MSAGQGSAVAHRFGPYGGQFVPETLMPALAELEDAWAAARADEGFARELGGLLRDFGGRPTPLYRARRLSERAGWPVYLKREDLNHTGSHKLNNALGQALLARRMGKRRIIAETGAGQHGVATATACSLLGLECVVYMGVADMRRQRPNVQRMELLGATVRPVEAGGEGIHTPRHGAPLTVGGRPGILHGSCSAVMQDEEGQILQAHSVSAGLDYPGAGPQHAFLRDSGRARYEAVTDAQALEAFGELARLEGIIPALETAHALAWVLAQERGELDLVCLSGRGDKDLATVLGEA